MKTNKLIAILLAAAAILPACKDDEMAPGNPTMTVTGNLGSACFGDSLTFTVKATDNEVPLSTIHADLYFGDELVSQKIIRTKVSGADYTGRIYVPYYANIPDGTATLRLTLQNIHFTTTEEVYNVAITHPAYPSLTFLAETGEEYQMLPDPAGTHLYSMTGRFPAELRGQIIAPAMGEDGNEITFGYENSEIKPYADGMIPFSNGVQGRYTISFDTYSFEGSPFVILTLNGQTLTAMTETTSYVDMVVGKGDIITPAGFPNFNDWWINPDYFTKNEDGTLVFNAYQGSYRIIADTKYQYFRVYKLNGNKAATLNNDGTGALWIIGEGIGHPSLSNQVGWTTENAICMAPVGEKTYQVTCVGGKTIATNKINFKFFGQMGWGVELTGTDLVSQSNLIAVGDGTGGHDNGNLYLTDGTVLADNGVYVITVDLTQGIHDGIMTVNYNGEQQFEEKPVYLNDVKMTTSDNASYSVVVPMTQGGQLNFREFSDFDDLYCDPDYFAFDPEAYTISFLPVSGYYNIVLNKTEGTLLAKRVNADGSDMTLQADGSGAIWMMGWGVGSPSLDQQFGWNPGAAYCMAEVSPKVYQFTGVAGPEKGSAIGDRFRFDYVSTKIFMQNGWGGEFKGENYTTNATLVHVNNDGNIELSENLEQGATYRLTIDVSNGTNAVLTFVKL